MNKNLKDMYKRLNDHLGGRAPAFEPGIWFGYIPQNAEKTIAGTIEKLFKFDKEFIDKDTGEVITRRTWCIGVRYVGQTMTLYVGNNQEAEPVEIAEGSLVNFTLQGGLGGLIRKLQVLPPHRPLNSVLVFITYYGRTSDMEYQGMPVKAHTWGVKAFDVHDGTELMEVPDELDAIPQDAPEKPGRGKRGRKRTPSTGDMTPDDFGDDGEMPF